MERTDSADHYYKISRRRTTWRGGKYYTMRRLPRYGAERIPQKSIIRSVYRKHMRDYWIQLDPKSLELAQQMTIYCSSRSRVREPHVSLKK